MRSRLYKCVELEKGYMPVVTTENSELRYLEFGRLTLPGKSDEYEGKTVGREAVLTIFAGRCSVEIESPSQKVSYKMIGERSDVFSGKPTMVYMPRNTEYRITAEAAALEAGISLAPSGSDCPPVLVKPGDVTEKSVGAWNWGRKVYTSIGENVEAERLIVGETINPPGNWSSSPPHKHDERSRKEAPLEEVYFYKLKPPQGFGLQRIYTAPKDKEPFDEIYVVENNDTVVLPRGYHPVVAAPGYELYYLWILAGEERSYGAWSDDPKHSWLKGCEPIVRDILHGL
ncbi:MAG: 5-deoxy-glucuronate isomerase [Candidatus Bathyarchaeota archaeon]|nr:5-deoxy-glucuronate isomerase [Candidatus Bathyarchaeota archaeon]